MSNFQQQKVQERRFRPDLDVRRKKHGLLVSQHLINLPSTFYYLGSVHGLDVRRVATVAASGLYHFEDWRADPFHSQSVGSATDIRWLQYWSTRLLRSMFCIDACTFLEATQVCHFVSRPSLISYSSPAMCSCNLGDIEICYKIILLSYRWQSPFLVLQLALHCPRNRRIRFSYCYSRGPRYFLPSNTDLSSQYQMVSWFNLVSGKLGGHDGALELLSTLGFHAPLAIYSYIFRLHCSDSLLQSRGMLPFDFIKKLSLLIIFLSQLGNTILTLISALIQLACLVWYLVSYFPMGSSG